MHAKGRFGRVGRRSAPALAALIPVLLLAHVLLAGSARAAVDMEQGISVELLARTGPASAGLQDFQVQDGGVLRTGDGLQLRLASKVDAYVYIIAYGSSNTAVLLHPYSAKADDARIEKGQQETIPEPGVYLPLDGREGRETLFTIATQTPLTNIAGLLARIEKHGDDVNAITAMLNADYPLARRLTFKHIGASPLVGVTVTAPRAPAGVEAPSTGAAGGAAAADPAPGASLLPPAGGGWAVSSSRNFDGAEAAAAPGAANAPSDGAADQTGAKADTDTRIRNQAHTQAQSPAQSQPPSPSGTRAAPVTGAGEQSADAATATTAAPPVTSAREKARAAAGIDEHQFRGILATLPPADKADVPEVMHKPFKEQGVLAAEGSRIRALERAQIESGARWPGDAAGSGENLQN